MPAGDKARETARVADLGARGTGARAHGETARAARHVGVLDGGDHGTHNAEHVGEPQARSQQRQAVAHGGRGAHVHVADVSAGVARGGDGVGALITEVAAAVRALEILRLGHRGMAQLRHVGVAHLHAGAIADIAAGRAGLGGRVIEARGRDDEARVGGIARPGARGIRGHRVRVRQHAGAVDEGHVPLDHVEQLGDIHCAEFAEQADSALARARERTRGHATTPAASVRAACHVVDVDDAPGGLLGRGLRTGVRTRCVLEVIVGVDIDLTALEVSRETSGDICFNATAVHERHRGVLVVRQQVGNGAHETVDGDETTLEKVLEDSRVLALTVHRIRKATRSRDAYESARRTVRS